MKKTLMATAATLLATSAMADVNIGNPMAMTGPIPDLNAPIAAAVDLAAANINEQGGMFADGETLNVVRADSGCDPTAAVDAVTKLINVNSVSAIVGPVCSGATIAQAESVSIPAGVITLSVSASSPAISTMEDGTDLVFRAAASDAYQGVALAELAIANGFTEMAVSYANDDYNAALRCSIHRHGRHRDSQRSARAKQGVVPFRSCDNRCNIRQPRAVQLLWVWRHHTDAQRA